MINDNDRIDEEFMHDAELWQVIPGDMPVPLHIAGNRNNLPEDQQMEVAEAPNLIDALSNTVSTVHRCQSSNARKLAIFDVAFKLKHPDNYDIGGTCTEAEPDVWFYYTTSICPGGLYLLNLFVCHRNVGNFSIGVSNSNELNMNQKKKPQVISLPESLQWYTFKSAQRDENHYIKTFKFTANNIKALEGTLYIPIEINMSPAHVTVNEDVIKTIKLNHDFGDLLSKQEKTDFILESATHKQYHTHKIILAAHSPVLRNLVLNTKSAMFMDLSNNDIELLLQFIYTGTIQDILKQDCLQLLKLADRFELKQLFLLMQYALSAQINVNNAVEIAILSEKYNLKKLEMVAFEFIKNNKEVLETDGWKNLDNVKLAKKLFQYKLKNKTLSD